MFIYLDSAPLVFLELIIFTVRELENMNIYGPPQLQILCGLPGVSKKSIGV